MNVHDKKDVEEFQIQDVPLDVDIPLFGPFVQICTPRNV
jgi:hypothetical protein